MARQSSKWASRVSEPHSHKLPRGYDYSDPANDRKCLQNGAHRGTETVMCAVGDCEHVIGLLCDNCEKVV